MSIRSLSQQTACRAGNTLGSGFGLLFAGFVLFFSLTTLADDEFEVAIFPYLSVHQLLELYEPLRVHLEQDLNRPVRLVTARDFPAFIDDTHRHPYPLLINAPHMARLAELEAGYKAIVRPVVSLFPAVVIEPDSGIESLEELRGAIVATPFASAVVTMMARELFHEVGLVEGVDVHFVHAGSHNNAVEQMLNLPEVKAAVVSNPALGSVFARYEGRVARLLVDREDRGLAPVVYLAGAGLDEAQRYALQQSLLRFANQTEAGQTMMQRVGHQALRAFTSDDRSNLDPFVPATRAAFSLP